MHIGGTSMKPASILLLPLALILASGISFGQIANTESPVCNAKFAQLLVEQQVGESKSVVEAPKRLKILLRSADFLWNLDQPTARSYFTEAFKTATDNFVEKGFEIKRINEKDASFFSILPDLRMDVVKAISKRDPQWAKRLTEQILAEYDKAAADRDFNNKTREPGDLLSLADANVRSNPEFARYIYRRVMRYPLFTDWFFSFYSAAGKDQGFAESIYSEALQNFRQETPRKLLFLSAFPFGNERIFGADKFTLGTTLPAHLASNAALQRQFLDVFFRRIAVFAASTDDINRVTEKNYQPEPVYMVSALNDIEPIVIERFPDLLQRFSVAKAQANSLLTDESRAYLADRDKWNTGLSLSFEDRIKMLEKADGEGKLKDYEIIRLIIGDERTEDQFVQIEPWLEKIKDESVKRETINYFWFLRSKLAIKEKRLDDANKYAAKVPEIEHRAILKFDIASEQLKNDNDAANVFETLNEVSKFARRADNSVAKAQILLALANLYERVNHSVALDELGEAVRVINQLDNPDIFGTSVLRQINGKGFSFFAVLDTPGYNLETTFSGISKKDFELSLANAKALDDKYFRTLAMIAVANNCVTNSKPAPKPKPNSPGRP